MPVGEAVAGSLVPEGSLAVPSKSTYAFPSDPAFPFQEFTLKIHLQQDKNVRGQGIRYTVVLDTS